MSKRLGICYGQRKRKKNLRICYGQDKPYLFLENELDIRERSGILMYFYTGKRSVRAFVIKPVTSQDPTSENKDYYRNGKRYSTCIDNGLRCVMAFIIEPIASQGHDHPQSENNVYIELGVWGNMIPLNSWKKYTGCFFLLYTQCLTKSCCCLQNVVSGIFYVKRVML